MFAGGRCRSGPLLNAPLRRVFVSFCILPPCHPAPIRIASPGTICAIGCLKILLQSSHYSFQVCFCADFATTPLHCTASNGPQRSSTVVASLHPLLAFHPSNRPRTSTCSSPDESHVLCGASLCNQEAQFTPSIAPHAIRKATAIERGGKPRRVPIYDTDKVANPSREPAALL